MLALMASEMYKKIDSMGAVSLIFSETFPVILSLPWTLQILESQWPYLPPGLWELIITAKVARSLALQFSCLGSPKHHWVAVAGKK